LSGRGSTIVPASQRRNRTRSENTCRRKESGRDRHNDIKRKKGRESVTQSEMYLNFKPHEEKKDSIEVASGTFKARPAPRSTTTRWNAGQMGIPKVTKRAVTVPVSPCLGLKRHNGPMKKANCDGVKKNFKIIHSGSMSGLSISSQTKIMSPSSVRRSPLLGLNLIQSTQKEKIPITEGQKNHLKPKSVLHKPFIPRSTTRANMRRQYDFSRNEKHALSLREKREALKLQIKATYRELKILSNDLA